MSTRKEMKMITRNAWENPEYIINLTTCLVGKNQLELLKSVETITNVNDLFKVLYVPLTVKIAKMRPETIGRICAYSKDNFLHHGLLYGLNGFLHLTSFKDLEPVQKNYILDCGSVTGVFALQTVVCTAYDIIRQDTWQFEREQEEELDRQLDRAEHQMTHPNRYK